MEKVISEITADTLKSSNVLQLVWNVFEEFEAYQYSAEGVREFQNYIEYSVIKRLLESSEMTMWGCFLDGRIIGMIATKPSNHISLLFVDKEYHRQGIARALYQKIIEHNECSEISVNSSLYAVEAYKKLGFVATDTEQMKNGIRFVPMKHKIRHKKINMRRKDREVKEIKEIEKILLLCKTCHVAMVDDGMPYVVPLSFGYQVLDEKILELYFHSALEGKKIDILRKSKNVCFVATYDGNPKHAETACNYGVFFASVIGYGETVFINDVNEKCEALSIMFQHQTGKDVRFTAEQTENVCVFKIVSSDFSGKRNF